MVHHKHLATPICRVQCNFWLPDLLKARNSEFQLYWSILFRISQFRKLIWTFWQSNMCLDFYLSRRCVMVLRATFGPCSNLIRERFCCGRLIFYCAWLPQNEFSRANTTEQVFAREYHRTSFGAVCSNVLLNK